MVVAQVQVVFLSCFVQVDVRGAWVVAVSALIVAMGPIPVISRVPLTGLTHEVMSGMFVEKTFAEVPAESKGAGSRGRVSSAAMSIATETFVSISTGLLRSASLGSVCVPSFSRSHCFLASVVNFASSRGRSRETVIRALSLSPNSKPIEIVGVNARLRARLLSVMLELNGSASRVVPLIPLTVVFVRSPSSTLMPAPSGIWV